MRLISVYNVRQNNGYITATIEYKNIIGIVRKRDVFYHKGYSYLMKYSNNGKYLGSIKYSIENEILNILEKQ